MDIRDSQTWVALELSKVGEEKIQEGLLESTLRKDLCVSEDFPIFIPVASYFKGTKRVVVVLMEGYAFVGTGLSDTCYFQLERQSYVERVLTAEVSGRNRVLTTIPNKTILELQTRLRKITTQDMPVGSEVKVTDGPYKNLSGTVLGLSREEAFVEIHLRSIELIATISRMLLTAVDPQ